MRAEILTNFLLCQNYGREYLKEFKKKNPSADLLERIKAEDRGYLRASVVGNSCMISWHNTDWGFDMWRELLTPIIAWDDTQTIVTDER